MGVTLGGADADVAKQSLYVADVRAAFQKVRGKSVAQAVDSDFFLYSGAADGFVKNVLGGANR